MSRSVVRVAAFGVLASLTAGDATAATSSRPVASNAARPVDLVERVGDLVERRAGLIERVDSFVVITESPSVTRVSIASDVLFAFDRSELGAAARSTLSSVLPRVRARHRGPASVNGYTDAIGTPAYNLRLSERRAGSVRRWFVDHGVPGSALVARGFGSTRPVAPNKRADGSDDPAGRRENRRVEIVIPKR